MLRRSHGRRLWRLCVRLLPAAAALNQQHEKQRHMRTQHQKENVAETFAAMMVDLDISQRSARNLKWIKFFHSILAQPIA